MGLNAKSHMTFVVLFAKVIGLLVVRRQLQKPQKKVALLGVVLLRNKVLEDVQTMIVMLIQYVKTFHSRQI